MVHSKEFLGGSFAIAVAHLHGVPSLIVSLWIGRYGFKEKLGDD